jgi:hypothetical protein
VPAAPGTGQATAIRSNTTVPHLTGASGLRASADSDRGEARKPSTCPARTRALAHARAQMQARTNARKHTARARKSRRRVEGPVRAHVRNARRASTRAPHAHAARPTRKRTPHARRCAHAHAHSRRTRTCSMTDGGWREGRAGLRFLAGELCMYLSTRTSARARARGKHPLKSRAQPRCGRGSRRPRASAGTLARAERFDLCGSGVTLGPSQLSRPPPQLPSTAHMFPPSAPNPAPRRARRFAARRGQERDCVARRRANLRVDSGARPRAGARRAAKSGSASRGVEGGV